MTDKINYDSMKKLFDAQLRTFVQKNSDYGNSFERSLDKHGLIASIVRMEDKMNRLSTLAPGDKDAQIASESLVDTLMDLSNYAAMSACWLMHEDDDSVYDPEMYDSDRIFSISTDIYTKDFQMLSAVIKGSVEEEENPLKLSNFEGHQEKVNELGYYNREDVSDEEIIKNWAFCGGYVYADLLKVRFLLKHGKIDEVKRMFNGALAPFLNDDGDIGTLVNALTSVINSVYGMTLASFDNKFKHPFVEDDNIELIHKILNILKNQNLTEDDNPELFRKIFGVLRAHHGHEGFKKMKDQLTGTDEEFEGRFNDLKETVFEQINSSREVVTTELKGLENGYVIRQRKNYHNSHRYTLAFNPEGTLKVEGDVAKPYVIECFSNDHDGTNTWAIHVFDTREDMVAALNYDLRRKLEPMNFMDSIKELDVKVSVFTHSDAPKVLNIWEDTFGEAFHNQMLSKDLNTEESIEKYHGIKTFGPVFISERTGALIIKGTIREDSVKRPCDFIWFGDTKEVLLDVDHALPKFNYNGIMHGVIYDDGKYVRYYNPLYDSMAVKIMSKFYSWSVPEAGSELKNLVFFNEDDEVSCEFMDKKSQIPSDSPGANAKNTVGEHELSLTFDKLKQEDISFSGLENSYFLRNKYVGKTSDDAVLSYTLAYTPGATIDIPKLNIDNKHFVLESCRKGFDIRFGLYVFETLEDLVETLYHNEQYPTADTRECFNHSVIHSNRKHPVRVYYGNTVKDLVINHLGSDKLYGRGFKFNFSARRIYDNPKFQNNHGVKLFETVRLIEDTETIAVKGVVVDPGRFKNGALGSHGFIWFSDTKEVILSDEGVNAAFNSDGALYGVLYDGYCDKNSPEYNNIYTNWSIIFQDSESIFVQDTLK